MDVGMSHHHELVGGHSNKDSPDCSVEIRRKLRFTFLSALRSGQSFWCQWHTLSRVKHGVANRTAKIGT